MNRAWSEARKTTGRARGEFESLGIFLGVDEDPAEEGRADQAVGRGRDGVGEEEGRAFAEELLNFIPQIIPLHQGPQGHGRPRQGPFHVRGPAKGGFQGLDLGPGLGIVVLLQRCDASHR